MRGDTALASSDDTKSRSLLKRQSRWRSRAEQGQDLDLWGDAKGGERSVLKGRMQLGFVTLIRLLVGNLHGKRREQTCPLRLLLLIDPVSREGRETVLVTVYLQGLPRQEGWASPTPPSCRPGSCSPPSREDPEGQGPAHACAHQRSTCPSTGLCQRPIALPCAWHARPVQLH